MSEYWMEWKNEWVLSSFSFHYTKKTGLKCEDCISNRNASTISTILLSSSLLFFYGNFSTNSCNYEYIFLNIRGKILKTPVNCKMHVFALLFVFILHKLCLFARLKIVTIFYHVPPDNLIVGSKQGHRHLRE